MTNKLKILPNISVENYQLLYSMVNDESIRSQITSTKKFVSANLPFVNESDRTFFFLQKTEILQKLNPKFKNY